MAYVISIELFKYFTRHVYTQWLQGCQGHSATFLILAKRNSRNVNGDVAYTARGGAPKLRKGAARGAACKEYDEAVTRCCKGGGINP